MDLRFHPIADIFPLLEGREFDDLAEDILEHGLREPIVLHEGMILDGRNRYRACLEAGVDVETKEYEGDDPVAYVVSLNLKRRHLTESQRSMVASELANMRQGARTDLAQISAKSQSDAARLLNVSRSSVQHASSVHDHGTPELQSAVKHGDISVSAASEIAREPAERQREIVARGEKEVLREAARLREERARANAEKRAAVAAREVTLPDGEYPCIVIDPPWPMEKIDRDVRPNQVGFDYPTMSEDELAALELPAADDCHLFLWTTHKFLPMALRLCERWGFRYVCTFVWHKPGGFQPIGLPQYNCEFALYCRRGSPKFVDTKAFFCCFNAERREHSRKPDDFYEMVARVTAGPRVDVFSREPRDGFDQLGNEVDKFSEAANG